MSSAVSPVKSPVNSPAVSPVSLALGGDVIDAANVSKDFGDQHAVRDVTLKVGRGTIVGLIGPSGCGKTTLVRLLTGILTPTSGTINVFGSRPENFTTSQRMRFGYMPQQPVLFPNLTVWGNLTFIASVYGVPLRHRKARLMAALDLVDLREHRKKRFSELSGGMQRRLSLAATLVHDPELVFLDEPTAGVDPILRDRFWTRFRELRDAGRTIIVPTQYVGEAVTCDQVAVMSEGRLLTVLSPQDLPQFAYGGQPLRVQLRDGYLGGPALARLRAMPQVAAVTTEDQDLIVSVQNIERDTRPVVEQLEAMGVQVDDAVAMDPDMDRVFMKIIDNDRSRSRADAAVEAVAASGARVA